MDWIKIKIVTSQKGLDFVSDIFENAGISSLEIEDNEEFLQVLEQTKAQWDFVDDSLYEEKSKACSVAGYVTDTPEGRKTLENIKNKIDKIKNPPCASRFPPFNKGGDIGEMFIAIVKEEDWAESWKKYFKPIAVGENILICPVWEEVPAEYKSRKVFKIDPGMSFGTGTHETTRLCVAALEKYINRDCLVLDLGCGSGILSVISMILGAKFAVAVDIDENCVRISEDNAKINKVNLKNYKVYAGNLLSDKKLRDKISENKYDLVLMNIIPDVIIPLLPFVKDLLKDNGIAVLSGIISRYLNDIETAVKSCGLQIVENSCENDWQCVVVKK